MLLAVVFSEPSLSECLIKMKLQLLAGGIILVISLYLIKSKSKNNVCKTFEDYYTDRDRNENCYYNPDGELTVVSIYFISYY